jgi:hypothetical protein
MRNKRLQEAILEAQIAASLGAHDIWVLTISTRKRPLRASLLEVEQLIEFVQNVNFRFVPRSDFPEVDTS